MTHQDALDILAAIQALRDLLATGVYVVLGSILFNSLWLRWVICNRIAELRKRDVQ